MARALKGHEAYSLAAGFALLLDGASSHCRSPGAFHGDGLIITGIVGILILSTRFHGHKCLTYLQQYQVAALQALVFLVGMSQSRHGHCPRAMQHLVSSGFWLVAGQSEISRLGMPLAGGLQLMEHGLVQLEATGHAHAAAILSILDKIKAQSVPSPPGSPIKAARFFDSPFKSKQVNFVRPPDSPPISAEQASTSAVLVPAALLDMLSTEVCALAGSTPTSDASSKVGKDTYDANGFHNTNGKVQLPSKPSVTFEGDVQQLDDGAPQAGVAHGARASIIKQQDDADDAMPTSAATTSRLCSVRRAKSCASIHLLAQHETTDGDEAAEPGSLNGTAHIGNTASCIRPKSSGGHPSISGTTAHSWRRTASMNAALGNKLRARSLLQRSKSAFHERGAARDAQVDGDDDDEQEASWKALDWGQDSKAEVSNPDKPHRVSLRTCLLRASSIASLSRASSVGDPQALSTQDDETGAFGSEVMHAWTSVGGSVASFSMSLRPTHNRGTPSIHLPESRAPEGEPTFSARNQGTPSPDTQQRRLASSRLSSDEDEELEQLASALGVSEWNPNEYTRRGSFCFQVPQVTVASEGQQAFGGITSTIAPASTPDGSPRRMSVDEPPGSVDLALAAYEASSLSNGSKHRGITTLRHIRSSNLLTLDNAIPEEATFKQGEVLMQQLLSNQSRMSSAAQEPVTDIDDLDAELLGLLPKEDAPGTSSPASSANGTINRGGRGSVELSSADKPCSGRPATSPLECESSAESGRVLETDALAQVHEAQATQTGASAGSSLSGITAETTSDMPGKWSRAPLATLGELHLSRNGKDLTPQPSSQILAHHNTGSSSGFPRAPHGPGGSGGGTAQQPGWWDANRVQASYRTTAVHQPAMRPRLTGVAGDSVEMEIEESILLNRRLIDARKTLIEEVKIEKVLGFGSMGMVYFGTLWSTRVVVKLIEHGAGLLGKEQNRGKLARQEAAVSRMLLHPNVVLTYDCCTGAIDAGRLKLSGAAAGRGMRNQMMRGGRQRQMTMMVQEFCDLGTLKDALGKGKLGIEPADPDYPQLITQIALDIAEGMKYMHQLRIMHLDLKAENVLLQHHTGPQGPVKRVGNVVAKVADFGLALVLPPDSDFHDNGIHGTVSHMPPEAMRDPVFSLATDVYSFGIVLWELVTQDKPFHGMAAHQVVEAVCDNGMRPAWPQELPPLFESLKALACDCWETSPLHRPSFADITDRLFDMLHPELKAQPSRNASSVARSETTDESDELELALKQQRKQMAAARAVMTAMLSNRGRSADDLGADVTGLSELQGGLAPHIEDQSEDLDDDHRGSMHTLQDVLSGPPPTDLLGRMLYYLAQMPPPADQMKRVLMEPGIVRLVLPVDMGHHFVQQQLQLRNSACEQSLSHDTGADSGNPSGSLPHANLQIEGQA